MDFKKTFKKIFNKKTAPIFITAILTIAAIIIFSCSLSRVGFFRSNKVEISFNEGTSLMESPASLSPGETWSKHTSIENTGKSSIYYRFYLDKLDGQLKDYIELCVMLNGNVCFEGLATEFNVKNAVVGEEALSKGEKVDILIVVFLSDDTVINDENAGFSFDIKVDAVQSKNNPDKIFK